MIKLLFTFGISLALFQLSMPFSILSKRFMETIAQDQREVEPFEEIINHFRYLLAQLSHNAIDHEMILARALMKRLIEQRMEKTRENYPDYWLLRQG